MTHKKSPVFVKLTFASFMTYGSIFFKNNILIAITFKKNYKFREIFPISGISIIFKNDWKYEKSDPIKVF